MYTDLVSNNKINFFKTLALLLILPTLIFSVKLVLDLRRSASGIPADIIVDSQSPQGAIPSALWQNISQGGEESTDMIKPIIPQLKSISPQLIRLDHLFDFCPDTANGNFSCLDSKVDSILATGAKPMLSLSYTPDSKAPSDWNQWYQLVKSTAKHFSVDRRISGIYYEVWNEPDLFGGWHYNKDPNYSTLYTQTSQAVVDGAGNTNYKIGGPAITAYYSNWIKSLFKTAADNNLRLDFISWHKYTKNLDDFDKDFENFNSIIADYPQFFNVERLITEIGPNSDPDPDYDNSNSGVHLISLVTRLSGRIHRLFSFEAVDGPAPRSEKSPGWGMISHDLKPKPRYYAFQFLNGLQGQRLASSGDGSWVTSLSAKSGSTILILLANYGGNHSETFPLTVQNLIPGKYLITTTDYLGSTHSKTVTTTVNYREMIYMTPNTAKILKIIPQQ